MRTDSVILGICGAFFGFLAGWMLHDQYAGRRPMTAPTTAQAPAQGSEPAAAPPRLDEARVGELRTAADRSPQDAGVRIELANLFFDAERYADAIIWYEAALKIDPRNVNASTDLGVAYYYSDQPDRALQQFDRSLQIDPKHVKTLLNTGIVRAFGKQDLPGAAAAWQQVVAIAPESPEGRAARQALDNIRTAHPEAAAAPGSEAR